MGMYCC
ncbi:hypothetical protein D043_2747A, partial [Vibrio parahaemolyticus EKP-021]